VRDAVFAHGGDRTSSSAGELLPGIETATLREATVQIHELKENWNAFGRTDPLWAILTDPAKIGNKWDPDEFFQHGQQEIDELVTFIKSIGIDLQAGEALDFGCGVGRLTQALVKYFPKATGVDIAPSMIDLAQSYNRQGDRCVYIVNDTDNLRVFCDNRFAFIYCNYVLQHMRPEYAVRYIGEFVRVLKPGGTLVFQLPSEIVALKERMRYAVRPWLAKAHRRLRSGTAAEGPVMETHFVPQPEVERVLHDNGGRLLHVRSRDDDPRWTSVMYFVSKRA
jgi:ubiquinone/menaquinone biosynthesis C-methylase UbiE